MKSALQAFFLLLAGATEKQLVRQVEYLKAENEILRGKLPKRITVTVAERDRLVIERSKPYSSKRKPKR